MAKLRVGIVNFLNSRPLAWGFLKGHHSELFEPSFHPPARVADMLSSGELDVGLIPSIEALRIPGLRLLPDLCVAAREEVESVLLVSREPLSKVRRVALDLNSRTSAVLVRLVLEDSYGVEAEYVSARADVERMLADADAALVIGDPALRVDRRRWRIWDLAAEWRRLTGLPFVFAVWAVRPGVEVTDLPFYFKSSLRYGLASMDTLVREAAAELGLTREEVSAYLTESLSFFLREEERQGLLEFYRRAVERGLAPAGPPPRFWGESAARVVPALDAP